MKRAGLWTIGILAGLAAGASLTFTQGEISQTVQRVLVENFPKVWQVTGKVSIEAPFPQAKFIELSETLVTTANPDITTRLISGGTLETNGFTEVVLSLCCQTKGDMPRAGRIGALLVPDVEPIQQAFHEQSAVQFPLEVVTIVNPGAAVFLSSNQPRYQIGFPRYRVYYFNTTERAVTAHLYAYLLQ